MNQTKALNDVIAERERQLNSENHSLSNDDMYEQNELVRAAAGYTNHVVGRGWIFERTPDLYRAEVAPDFWPWKDGFWKPKSPRQDLVRAAALLLAEIERIDRKEAQVEGHE